MAVHVAGDEHADPQPLGRLGQRGERGPALRGRGRSSPRRSDRSGRTSRPTPRSRFVGRPPDLEHVRATSVCCGEVLIAKRIAASVRRTKLLHLTVQHLSRQGGPAGTWAPIRPSSPSRSCSPPTTSPSRWSPAACAATAGSTTTAPTCRPGPCNRVPAIAVLAGAAHRAVRHRAARAADRDLARALPERRPGAVPDRGRRAGADHLGPHPHRHRRGLRRVHPQLDPARLADDVRRGHPRHRHRAPRRRALRGPRARRGGPRGRGRPQADVVRGRDIAFEDPVTGDMTVQMLERMGIATPGGRWGGRSCRAAGDRAGQPHPPRRHRLRPRVAAHPDDPAAPHRDLRVPRLRVGRGDPDRHRPRRRRGRRRSPRVLHPVRRDPARRVPAHGPLRDAGPHGRRAVGHGATRGAT